MRRTLLILILLMVNASVNAENLDSLQHLLSKKDLPISDRITICDKLSWDYLDYDFEKACQLANEGLTLAKKEKDVYMLGRLYRNLGTAYTWSGKRDSARIYLDEALKYTLESGNERLLASIYGSIGNIFAMENKAESAIEYYFKALQLYEKINEQYFVLAVIGNIGVQYLHIGNYPQAEAYLLKAEKMCMAVGDSAGVLAAATGLAEVCLQKQDFDKALKYALRAIDISHTLGLKADETTSLQTVSQVYNRGYKNYEKAIDYAQKSLKLAKEVGYPAQIIAAYNALSSAQFHAGRYVESEKNARLGLEADSTSIVKRNLLYTIASANLMMGKKKLALEYFNHYDRIAQAMIDQEFQTQLSEMEVKYETEKKELQITSMQEERKLYLLLGIAVAALLLAIIAFFIARHRLAISKLNLSQQRLQQMEQEQQLMAAQAVMDGETAERTRLARDLHDGLGGMLSAVKLNLRDIKNVVDLEKEVEHIQTAKQMLDRSISELHRVAHHMMPDMLLRYGLKTSLEEFCASIPTVEFHYFGSEGRLDNRLEVLIYRCTHELVNNAVKHANASHIYVQLVKDSERIALTVQDDGMGFDPEVQSSGIGLPSLRNRLSVFNGKMEVSSSKENGTEVFIEIMLK